MVYLTAFLLFVAIAAVTWMVGIALAHSFLNVPDLRLRPNFVALSMVPVGLVGMMSLFPFPAGYLLSLVVWWFSVLNLFELSFGQTLRLFLTLAALSIVSRLVILGVLSL